MHVAGGLHRQTTAITISGARNYVSGADCTRVQEWGWVRVNSVNRILTRRSRAGCWPLHLISKYPENTAGTEEIMEMDHWMP